VTARARGEHQRPSTFFTTPMQGQCGARPSEWASSPRGLDTLKPGRPSATTAPVAVQCRGRNSSGVAELCRRWEVEGRVAERRQKIEVNKSVESRKGRGQGRRCARQVESGNPRGRATPQQATPIRRRQAGRPHRQTSQDDAGARSSSAVVILASPNTAATRRS
jgi:hypothetical protein